MTLAATALPGLPEVRPGDDLAALLAAAATAEHALRDGDVLAVAHKVVSKAEGRVRDLADVAPGDRARELATAHDKDARAPDDPDASARALRARLRELTSAAPAVVITDSFGRTWRHGQCDVAIGCAGLAPLQDWRGGRDAEGRELRATWIAVADEAAAAADLARAKDSREPAVRLRGLDAHVTAADGAGAAALRRPPAEDLFR